MSLSMGIVGLPNVGKSTIFNVLTGAQNAVVANYPFCTIQPNRAIVPLPDDRLEKLAAIVKVSNVIHATVEFVDIAGLVKGAHQGEGLGNQFLAHIRDTKAILHIVRCFDDPNVVHVSPNPSPREDIETIEIELALADLYQLDRKIERLTSAVKGNKKLQDVLDVALRLKDHLAAGKPSASFSLDEKDAFKELEIELRFLTAKPVIFVANVDEAGFQQTNRYLEEAQIEAAKRETALIAICAKLEEDLLSMRLEERNEYLALSGIESSGLEKLIKSSFSMLNLISFFTFNQKEVRSWSIPRGSTAQRAAGEIHSDIEKGFIRAEVIPFETILRYGSSSEVKSAGQLQLEGKEYVVQDGDVVYFRFNI